MITEQIPLPSINNKSKFKIRKSPSGLVFFDRKTGTHVLIDEISIPKEYWNKSPRTISIALTNA